VNYVNDFSRESRRAQDNRVNSDDYSDEKEEK
jgi:hypothetical protein